MKQKVCVDTRLVDELKRRLQGSQELSATKEKGQGQVQGNLPWGAERAGGPPEVLGGRWISHGSWDGEGRQAISVKY